LQFCGINLPLDDFKLVYDTLNYDNSDGIDFQKFCLINPDKYTDIFKKIEEIKENKLQAIILRKQKETINEGELRPPKFIYQNHKLVADQIRKRPTPYALSNSNDQYKPKNKNINEFQ
jgi:hypothetical protein